MTIRLSIRGRLQLMVGAFVATLVILLGYALHTVQLVKVRGPLYDAIILDKDLIADILPPPAYIIESYLVTLQLVEETDDRRRGQLERTLRALQSGAGGYEERHRYWAEHLPATHDAIRAELLERSGAPANKFYALVDREILPTLVAGDRMRARELAHGPLRDLFDQHRAAIDEVVKLANADFDQVERRTEATLASRIRGLIVTGVVLVAAAILGIAWPVARGILQPIRQTADMLRDISEGQGDLTRRLAVDRQDELGEVAGYFNQFVEKLERIIGRVAQHASTVARAATELSAVSSQTSSSVEQLSSQTSTAAAAAEEASANTASVASSMEQTSASLGSVAAATEEMTSTIGEISGNSERARAISAEAAQQAESVSGLVQQLDRAALDIGKVTETISEISSQTNLLALNATIEAARAGSAGKGFGVVANEIKELAQQTAEATEDIKTKISAVQTAAGQANADIARIAGVITEVRQYAVNIATAIEEQSAVTRDVAQNIAQASSGVKDANGRVAETATVSKTMAEDLAGVHSVAAGIREGGEQVQASAEQLSTLAHQLTELVGQFKTGVSTAEPLPPPVSAPRQFRRPSPGLVVASGLVRSR